MFYVYLVVLTLVVAFTYYAARHGIPWVIAKLKGGAVAAQADVQKAKDAIKPPPKA